MRSSSKTPIIPRSGVSFTGGVQPPTLSELKNLSDDELMAHLQNGCHDALAILFDRYYRLVLSIALKIVRDSGEAEEVLQVVFMEIFKAVAQFDPARGTTKVWILQYAYHRAISRKQHLNARKFYTETDLEEIENRMPETPPTLGRFTQTELKHLLQQGLGTLNSPQKRVVELASYEGLSMSEIAEKTGDTLSNVRHHYYRGLQKLRSFVGLPEKRKEAGGHE
jgi:RNA polymerase sigma-70 factor (ECF subfamily)